MINFRGGVRGIGVLATYEGSYWISQHLKLQYPLDERFVLLLFVCFIFKLIPFCLLLELEFFSLATEDVLGQTPVIWEICAHVSTQSHFWVLVMNGLCKWSSSQTCPSWSHHCPCFHLHRMRDRLAKYSSDSLQPEPIEAACWERSQHCPLL